MPVDRHDVADAFREIASLLEAMGENPFKIRAYVNGARALDGMDGDLGALIESGELARTRGFGQALVEKATTLWRTGRLPYLEELRAKAPASAAELQNVAGLGPKKAQQIRDALGISTLDELEAACRDGRVAELPGFGAGTVKRILEGIPFAKQSQARRLLPAADEIAMPLLRALRRIEGVQRAELAGSLRRRRETIGDLDLVACADDPGSVVEAWVTQPLVRGVVSRGGNRASVRVASDVQADLIVVEPAQWGAALLHFTGSKDFNAALRGHAKTRGLKLNEYGLFRGEQLVRADDEGAILRELGLCELPPETREDAGDVERALAVFERALAVVERALAGSCPPLVQESDLRGVLHVHSTYSDGRDTLRDMVATAQEHGWEYVGISDHSQTASYANGMSVERLLRQHEELDELQESASIRILRGVESDILPDGSLDFPDDVLARLDFVIASVHSQFRTPAAEMTRRIVRAVSHPRTRVLGHPTGRLLLSREGYTFDLDEVFRACRENDVAIEINAWPNRLDLDWRHARRLRDAGVKACINPDAHRTSELAFVSYGAAMARKAWLGPDDVINTRDAAGVVARRAG